MTAEPHTSWEHAEEETVSGDQRRDLSAAFGHPATASLAGLLPPRPRRSTEDGPATSTEPTGGAEAPTADAPEDAEPVAEEPADATPTAPAPRRPDRSPRPARASRPTSAPAAGGSANRRWGTARLASQEHVELLVLVALRRGPADGRELVARLRADSDGGLDAPPTTVQRTLHHLLRHGLVERVAGPERRRFGLTETGIRVTRARVRAWRALRRAVDAVVDATDQG